MHIRAEGGANRVLWTHPSSHGYQRLLAAELYYHMASCFLYPGIPCTLLQAANAGPPSAGRILLPPVSRQWFGAPYVLQSCVQPQFLAIEPFCKQTSSPVLMTKTDEVVLAYNYYISSLLYYLCLKQPRTLKLPK